MEYFVIGLDGQFTAIQYLDMLFRIIMACILGAVIGIERTKRLKVAGIRTHMIVSCASALMMIVSKYGFMDVVFADVIKTADPARLAAQVISGISFLGAGIIFHQNSTVKGLTTAAGIWATAGIGLCVGAGMYGLAVFVTAVIFVLQYLTHKYSVGADALLGATFIFVVEDKPEMKQAVNDLMESLDAQIEESGLELHRDGFATYEISAKIAKETSADEVLECLKQHGMVKKVNCTISNGQ